MPLIIIFYFAAMLISTFMGIVRFKKVDAASKILVVLLIATILTECVAYYFAVKYRNNMIVYHVFAPVQLFVLCLYFQENIVQLKRKQIGLKIGLLGMVLGWLNTRYIQPANMLNSYFLLFAGFCIISLSLYSFYVMLDNDDIEVIDNPHFWFALVLLFFWSATYFNWALYNIQAAKMYESLPLIGEILLIVNIITYLTFAVVYFLYPKKELKHG